MALAPSVLRAEDSIGGGRMRVAGAVLLYGGGCSRAIEMEVDGFGWMTFRFESSALA